MYFNIFIYLQFFFIIALLSLFNIPTQVHADSTSSQFSSTIISSSYDGSNQVGTIIAWYSKRSPGQGWLECNGQSFNSETYPKLYLYLGQKNVVPDLRNLFLRAGTSTTLGNVISDTIASHTIDIAEQSLSHGQLDNTTGQAYLPEKILTSNETSLTVSGSAQGQKISGATATSDIDLSSIQVEGQKYTKVTVQGSNQYYWARDRTGQDNITENYYPLSGSSNKYYNTNDASLPHDRSAGTQLFSGSITTSTDQTQASNLKGKAKITTNIQGTTDGGTISGTATGRVKSTISQSNLAASLTDGSVSGVIGAHHGTYSGATETAPKHIYVRYFIRAL